MFGFKKILIAGDVHGDIRFIKYLLTIAHEHQCEAIVQLGDLGYFPDTKAAFLEEMTRLLSEAKINLFFIDGNHENFEELWKPGKEKTDDGFVKLDEHLFYIERGHRWIWNGISFLGLGGAVSLDKNSRKTKETWYPNEAIRYQDIHSLITGDPAKVDILLTHDCPKDVSIPNFNHRRFDNIDGVLSNQSGIMIVGWKTRPALMMHGHLHHKYMSVLHRRDDSKTLVVGLDCNKNKESGYYILDLEEEKNGLFKK